MSVDTLPQPKKPAPSSGRIPWPRMSSAVSYDDAAAAIDWLCRAFGFEVRLKVQGEDGRIQHSELMWGESVIMVAQAGGRPDRPTWPTGASPNALGGANTQSIMLFVDDAEAHCAHARAQGATIVQDPTLADYGEDYWADKSYGAVDCGGHMWWFTERVRDPK